VHYHIRVKGHLALSWQPWFAPLQITNGDGIRLFDHLGTQQIVLEQTSVIEAPGVTHLTFRVVK